MSGYTFFVMTERSKKRLGEILIEDGILAKEHLEEALSHQKKEGGLIGQILVRLGYISEEDLIAAVGKQLKVPYLPLSNYSLNTDIAQQYSQDFCRRNQVIVFEQNEKYVYLALADPLNDLAIEEIQKKTGLKVQVFISTPTEILSMLDVIANVGSSKKENKKG